VKHFHHMLEARHFTVHNRVLIVWCLAHSGTCDQILLPVWGMSESCCLVSVGLVLWREIGSAVCRSHSVVICRHVH
jgi:hypothetical protein